MSEHVWEAREKGLTLVAAAGRDGGGSYRGLIV